MPLSTKRQTFSIWFLVYCFTIFLATNCNKNYEKRIHFYRDMREIKVPCPGSSNEAIRTRTRAVVNVFGVKLRGSLPLQADMLQRRELASMNLVSFFEGHHQQS
ncbi:hypothetical protein MAPG_08362 [Magnaporthiopsis poae ATCC 64411]|uniref:Uncharacterized protein n=1 Tax=Magnaporthiopsis poae (strain ATCC 64411 / 73-15) TaxID=644358 RepID=A0A0C4E760_MAGP6|nr:hypothetical protein MAPG_08362 [Magnaporthiopsis poae ATCC 64411]